jgi:hypothetical protein
MTEISQTMSDIRQLPTLNDYGELKSNITNYQSQRQLKFTDTATVQKDNFSRGLLSYEFQVGPNELACMKDSYFKTIAKLTVNDAGTFRQPNASDDVALAENFMNNLLQSCSFSVGNTIICDQNDLCGQISMTNYRLTKTKNWFDAYKNVFFLEPSFQKRQNETSSDGSLEETKEVDLRDLSGVGYDPLTSNVAFTAADPQVLTITDTPQPVTTEIWRPGDLILYDDTTAVIASVAGNSLTLDGPYPNPQSPGSTNFRRLREDTEPNSIFDGKNEVEILWQPPLSIFHESANGLLCQGQYKLKITPKSDKLSAFEQIAPNEAPTNLSLLIKSNTLVLKTFSSTKEIAMDGTFYLELPEWDIQNRQANQGRGQTNVTFTVPVTTHLLALYLQDSSSGVVTSVPPSKFIAINNSQGDIRHLTTNFAGVTKPANVYKSELTANVQNQTQRYFETVRNVGMASTSFETMPNWVTRGNIYATSFVKEKGDLSTLAQINIDFGDLAEDIELFCCAFSRRIVRFTIRDGFIVRVQAIEG